MSKIVQDEYDPLSENYSSELRNLVKMMLIKDDLKRPNINQILKYQFVQYHMQKYVEASVKLKHELKGKKLVIESDNRSISENKLSFTLNLNLNKNKNEEEIKSLEILNTPNKPKLRLKLVKINLNIKSDLKSL